MHFQLQWVYFFFLNKYVRFGISFFRVLGTLHQSSMFSTVGETLNKHRKDMQTSHEMQNTSIVWY